MLPFTALWRWSIGAGPLPSAVSPVQFSSALTPFNDCVQGGILADKDLGTAGPAAGKWYLNQYRAINDVPCLFVVSSDGTTVLWDSQSTSRALLGDAAAADLLLTTRGIKVSADGTMIACMLNNSNTIIVPLDANGYPDLANRVTLVTGGTVSGRDICWDAAGNVYIATSGHAAVKIWSSPKGPHANTTTQAGSFSLGASSGGGPTITAQPSGQTLCPGASAAFSVTAAGTSPTYQWRKNGVPISGATSASLTYNGPTNTGVVLADDGAVFTVDVCDNNVVRESDPAVLTVGPALVVEPANATVCTGQNASFSVTARGVGPFTYQWQKDNAGDGTFADISGANSSSITEPGVLNTQYRCVVGDGCSLANSLTSPAAKVRFARPLITQQPADQLHKCQGGTATFSVVASTTAPPLGYQWSKGATALTDGVDANGVVISGSGTATLTLSNLNALDNNTIYRCLVSDQCGGGLTTASLGGKLTFDIANITAQPASTGVYAGQTANFSVTATDPLGGTLAYQWRKSGTNISGANASTVGIPTTYADAGANIDVIVTNSCGPKISSAAKLNVVLPACSKAWADKHLLPPTGPRLDGIYIDSMPNWGEVRNWRREHWRTVATPLTFDPDTRQPVLLQMLSTWQFSKWVADDVHARGGVMHGNGGALWPYFPALLDVTGQETGGILTAETMAMARTLLRDKPYSPLLNTRFSQLPPDYHVSYFHRSALWCIFPSYFNGDYFENGKWVIGRFFDKPEIYEPVRPLYKQFIPILRRMYAAGWQPVTVARAEPASLRVERYGGGQGREALLALYNPGKEPVTATLTVPLKQLGLQATGATGLVSATELPATAQGDTLTIKVPLAADRCEVVQLRP